MLQCPAAPFASDDTYHFSIPWLLPPPSTHLHSCLHFPLPDFYLSFSFCLGRSFLIALVNIYIIETFFKKFLWRELLSSPSDGLASFRKQQQQQKVKEQTKENKPPQRTPFYLSSLEINTGHFVASLGVWISNGFVRQKPSSKGLDSIFSFSPFAENI